MNSNNVMVPAFTIIEAVVSMVITAIILSIIFVIFSIMSERLLDFKKQNEHIADLTRLNFTVNKAIFDSEQMLYADDELLFTDFYGDVAHYTIYDKYFTVARHEFTDTFHLSVKQIRIDTMESKSKKSKYQRLQWLLNIDNKNLDLNFYKKIYANQSLKADLKK